MMKESEDNMEPCIPQNICFNIEMLKIAIENFIGPCPEFPNDGKLAENIGEALGKLQVSVINYFLNLPKFEK